MSDETAEDLPDDTRLKFTVGTLKMILGDLGKVTGRFTREAIAAAVEPLERRIAELETQLEARTYAGAWASDKRYKRHQFATFDGSLWVAKQDSVNVRPATSREHWQLAVRRGADGKDLRDAVQ